MQIGFILFPKLTQLDLIGPAEVFYRVPGPAFTCSGRRLSQSRPTAACRSFPRCDLLTAPLSISFVFREDQVRST